METTGRYRTETLKARDRLTPFEITQKSGVIHERFLQIIDQIPSQTIFIYVSYKSEVDTLSLIKKLLNDNKTITVPHVLTSSKTMQAVRLENLENDLVPGYFGILEPREDLLSRREVNPSTIDVVVLPGSVFDLQGGRLGYGGGFYDKFLATKVPEGVTRIAFSFELQIKNHIPQQVHDEAVDYIVTEERVIFGKRQGCKA